LARFAFFNVPAHGHVNPTVPVVAELIRRGHAVVYYNAEEFRGPVERSGTDFRPYPVAGSSASTLTDVAPNLANVSRWLLAETRRLLPFALGELDREEPDVVVFDAIALWGMQAARLRRLPSVASISTLIQDGVKGSLTSRDTLRLLRQALPAVPGLLRHRSALVRTYGKEVFPRREIFPALGDVNVVYTSREFQPATPFITETFRFVGPVLDPSLRVEVPFPWDWLSHGEGPGGKKRPVAYASLGTVYDRAADFYRQLFDAFSGHAARFVLSVGRHTDPAVLESAPANFLVRRSVPQLALLEHADLFITHGGLNSVHEGLVHGVPLLVVPRQLEQVFNARQVVAAVAGLMLGGDPPYGRTDRSRLLAAADRLLSDASFGSNARRIGATLRAAGGSAAAADAIEQLITGRPGPGLRQRS